VLVIYDLLGMDPSFSPKFVKRYADLHQVIGGAVRAFLDDVRSGAFPTEAHSFRMAPAKAQAALPATGNLRVVDEEKVGAIYGGSAEAKR
jgi:3-methyl-2-oxobutanoate hydroxymethyltransferase